MVKPVDWNKPSEKDVQKLGMLVHQIGLVLVAAVEAEEYGYPLLKRKEAYTELYCKDLAKMVKRLDQTWVEKAREVLLTKAPVPYVHHIYSLLWESEFYHKLLDVPAFVDGFLKPIGVTE